MLRDDEYTRIQTIFLAIAKHSQPQERARWLALVRACQEELLTVAEMRLLATGMGKLKIARQLGIGTSVVQRVAAN